jgi:dihydrofolate reductase
MPHDTAAMPAAAPKPVSLIVACTGEGGIGKDGQLPWRLPGDMAYFKRVTTGGSAADAGTGEKLNAVVMGRKTWDSIPAKFRPLAGRVNVVLSRNPGALGLPADVLGATSLPDALSAVDDRADIDQCFIIGGAEVYREALKLPRLCKVVARPCTCAWTDAPGACLVAHLCRACKMLWDAAPLYVVCVLSTLSTHADVARHAEHAEHARQLTWRGRQVYRTLVHGSYDCDAFIPAELPPSFERDAGMPAPRGFDCVRAATVRVLCFGI